MTEKRGLRERVVRVVLLMLGLCIAHLGVTLFLLSDLCSDPFNVLVQGIFRTLDRWLGWPVLTHGRVHIALSLLIIFVLLLTDRSYVKIGTVLCMVFGGPIIDGYTLLLGPAFAGAGTLVCMLLVGLVAGLFLPVNGRLTDRAVARFGGGKEE